MQRFFDHDLDDEWLQVSWLGFRGSGSEFWVSSLGVRGSGFGVRVSGVGIRFYDDLHDDWVQFDIQKSYNVEFKSDFDKIAGMVTGICEIGLCEVI